MAARDTWPLMLLVIGGATIAEPAHAYLDPSTSSTILQLLLGGIAGIWISLRLYWRRIKSFFDASPTSGTNTDDSGHPKADVSS